jgi:hypothetical protein
MVTCAGITYHLYDYDAENGRINAHASALAARVALREHLDKEEQLAEELRQKDRVELAAKTYWEHRNVGSSWETAPSLHQKKMILASMRVALEAVA